MYSGWAMLTIGKRSISHRVANGAANEGAMQPRHRRCLTNYLDRSAKVDPLLVRRERGANDHHGITLVRHKSACRFARCRAAHSYQNAAHCLVPGTAGHPSPFLQDGGAGHTPRLPAATSIIRSVSDKSSSADEVERASGAWVSRRRDTDGTLGTASLRPGLRATLLASTRLDGRI